MPDRHDPRELSASDVAMIRRWFGLLWRQDRGWMLWLLAGSAVSAALSGAFPWLWQYLVDALEAGAEPARINALGLWILAVGAGQAIFYMSVQYIRSIINARIQVRARARVFDHISRQPEGFFDRWRPGDLVTRLTDDAGEKTAWFMCSGVFRAAEAGFIVIACLAAMLALDPVMTAWVALPLPGLILVQILLQGRLAERYQVVQGAISALNDQLTTTFSGIRIVRASQLEPAASAGFAEASGALKGAQIHKTDVEQGIYLMYGHGWQVAVVALLLAGGARVISGEASLGAFVSFEGYVMTLVWPMFDFGMFVSRYLQSSVALRRLEEVIAEPAEVAREGGEVPSHSGLSLEGLVARAADGERLLGPLSAQIAPGEMVAVVGEVGAGKSTLLRWMTGGRPPAAGRVELGGVAPEEADVAALRAAVAYVPQDPVVISGTVRDNILLGREVPEDALARAVEIARLAQDLPQLPKGLDTTVGERGVTLSGGQQQRVALARALVGEPRVLLLDDATAALDADTEAAFWRELDAVLPDVTAVVVTHRLSTLERADRVLVLERGDLVQQGPHATLIGADGPYRRIYGRYRALAQVEG